MPLLHALRCAADLAAELRDLHAIKGLHGSVTPVFVALEPRGAVLLPAPGSAALATPEGDIRSFGAVLYEMLVGRKLGREPFDPLMVSSPYDAAWTEVFQSALGTAQKCLAATPDSIPNLQNIANELRLLLLIANRSPARRRPGPVPAAEAAHPPEEEYADDEEDWEDEEDGDWDDLTDLFCPSCGTQDVHWSGLRTPLERFLGRMGIPFYRCHRCFHRYMVVLGIRIRMVNPL